MGNGQWAMGNGQWAMGNGQWATDPECNISLPESAIVLVDQFGDAALEVGLAGSVLRESESALIGVEGGGVVAGTAQQIGAGGVVGGVAFERLRQIIRAVPGRVQGR
jgi:hypothetical protein